MNEHARQLFEKALALPEGERGELAASLIESLDRDSDANADAAWADEIKRRIAAIDAGDVTLIPWDDVMRSIRESVDG